LQILTRVRRSENDSTNGIRSWLGLSARKILAWSGFRESHARRQKKQLADNLIEIVKSESAQMIKEVRDKAKEEAKRDAHKLIIQAIQRTAADHTVESTVSVLNLESDEMKGRIIGRRGGTLGHLRLPQA